MSGSKPVWYIVAKAEDENGLHYACVHSSSPSSKDRQIFAEAEVMVAILTGHPFMTARINEAGEVLPQKEVKLLLRTKKSSSEAIEDNLRDVVSEEFSVPEYIDQMLFPQRFLELKQALAEALDKALKLGPYTPKKL